jgi:hypothetical protein
MLITNNLNINTKANIFWQRSTSFIAKDLKVNINVTVALDRWSVEADTALPPGGRLP